MFVLLMVSGIVNYFDCGMLVVVSLVICGDFGLLFV